MKKNHNHQILERIIVPGSKKNNQIVTELIERTSDL